MESADAVRIILGNGLASDFWIRVLREKRRDNSTTSSLHFGKTSIFRIRPLLFEPGDFYFALILENSLIS